MQDHHPPPGLVPGEERRGGLGMGRFGGIGVALGESESLPKTDAERPGRSRTEMRWDFTITDEITAPITGDFLGFVRVL